MKKILLLLFIPLQLFAQDKTIRDKLKINIYEDEYQNVAEEISDNKDNATSGLLRLDAVESDISTLQTNLSNLDLSIGFDSLVLSDDETEIYGYVTLESGQIKITLDVNKATDPTTPTFSSAIITDDDPDIISITMSEYIWADSVLNYSGASGSTFDGADHAYEFNEPDGFKLDDKIGSDDGTNSGAAQSDSTGIDGYAYYLDGSDVITLDAGTNFGSNNVSISLWAKPFDLDTDEWFIGGTNGALALGYQASSDGLWIADASAVNISGPTDLTLTEDAWNHIVIAYDQSEDTVGFWINGAEETESFSYEFTAASTLFGARKVGVTGYLEGLLDDVIIFDNKLLIQSTVDSVYNSGAGRRYDESGGGLTETEDSIKNAFTVSITPDGGQTIDTIRIASNKVNVVLDSPVEYDDVVTIAYTKPVSGRLVDSAYNVVDSWTAQSVTNDIDTAASYTVKETWNFETEDIGGWSNAELDAYFLDAANVYTHSLIGDTTTYIVEDTINGAATKVLRIINRQTPVTDPIGYDGAHWNWHTQDTVTKIMMSFNARLGENYLANPDLKFPGIESSPVPPANRLPESGEGFRIDIYNVLGSEMHSYFYTRTKSWAPTSQGTSDLDSVFMVPNVWYNFTLYLVLNSTPTSYDGIFEWWMDGRLMNSTTGLRILENEGIDINGLGIRSYCGGSKDENKPEHDFYVYYDNFNTFIPYNDASYDAGTTHSASTVISSPGEITDKVFNPDSTRTTTGTLSNSEWGSTYSSALEEQYLLDAGAGNTISIEFVSGCAIASGDYLFIYDGNETDDYLKEIYTGQSIPSGTTVTSSDRYMFMRFNTKNRGTGTTGWSVTISHE